MFSRCVRFFTAFVLISFLWSVLHPTIAFADIIRAKPDPISIEHIAGKNYRHYDVGVRDLKETTVPITGIYIPEGQSNEVIQNFFNKTYVNSIYQNLTISENGLSWNSLGVDFYFDTLTNHLVVKHNKQTPLSTDRLFLKNMHGTIILSSDLTAKELSLHTKDVIQDANLSVEQLHLDIAGTYLNNAYLSVRNLLFQGNTRSVHDLSTLPCFVNKGEVRTRNRASLKGNGRFINKGLFLGEGSVHIRNLVFLNKSSVSIYGTVSGHIQKLINFSVFECKSGFNNLHTDQFLNDKEGRFTGNGSLSIGRGENHGEINASELTLTVNKHFSNKAAINARNQFNTLGVGSFYQRGILKTKKAIIDTYHFENFATIDDIDMDMTVGSHVFRFKNQENGALHIRKLNLVAPCHHHATAENHGFVHVEHFDNHHRSFTNQKQLKADTWHQRGATVLNKEGGIFNISKSADLVADFIQNHGKMHLSGAKGTVNQLDNKQEANLTVSKGCSIAARVLNNEGHLMVTNEVTSQAPENFTFKGKSFNTADTSSIISDANVIIETEMPLTLRGKISSKTGATFTAPTVDNYAVVQVDSGETHINGVLTSYAHMDVDQLVYSASELTIAGTGKLKANRFNATNQMDIITNSGTFISHDGAFETKRTVNAGCMALENGQYTLGILENKEGATLQTQTGFSKDANEDNTHVITDIINNGQLLSSNGMILDSLDGVTKLGLVQIGGDLTVKINSDAANYIANELANWQMASLIVKGTDFNVTQQLTCYVPLTLDVINFINQSLLCALKLTINSKTFRNGISQGTFGCIKTSEDIDITVEESLYNQFGKINAGMLTAEEIKINKATIEGLNARNTNLKGRITAKSLEGSIHNGAKKFDSTHNPNGVRGIYVTNGSYMSAGLSILLEARKEVHNYFGELISDDRIHLKAGEQIANTAGRILSIGGMIWEAPFAIITRNGGHIDNWDPTRPGGGHRRHPTSHSALVAAGGDIHFKVGGLTIRGSDVTAFGKIYDKEDVERTQSYLGYFNLETITTIKTTFKGEDIIDFIYGSTLSSATEVSFNFAHNIVNGLLASGGIQLNGVNLTIDGLQIGQTHTPRGRGLHRLLNYMPLSEGGAIKKLSANPYAVVGTGNRSSYALSPDRLVNVLTPGIESLFKQSQENYGMRRQMLDMASLSFSLQSCFLQTFNRGYAFGGKGLHEHFDQLMDNALELSGGLKTLKIEAVKQSKKPLLISLPTNIDGECVDDPHIFIPTSFVLENAHTAGLISQGGIKTHMSGNTTIRSVPVLAEDEIDIESGSLFVEGSAFKVRKNKPISIRVHGDAIFVPKIKRIKTPGGYLEEIEMCAFKGGSIKLKADGTVDMTAIRMNSDSFIHLSAQQISDRYALLMWENTTVIHNDDDTITIKC
ncbi:MAG: hypothetical protein Q8S21_02090, partial [Candidatus Paracaedibacteraceae bacterium]|nr:hypothetical protein [Candidatus Paracaedibacteraceae bacterium]